MTAADSLDKTMQGQQARRIAMFDELVGQAELQQRAQLPDGLQELVDRTARAAHDRAFLDRHQHRMLLDSTVPGVRGNIQVHDVVGDELILSVTPDPRPDFVQLPVYIVLNLESGVGRTLDATYLRSTPSPEAAPNASSAPDDDAFVESMDEAQPGEYEAPWLGDSFVRTTDGTPEVVVSEDLYDAEDHRRACIRGTPLATLVSRR